MKLRFTLLSILLLATLIMALPFTGKCLPPEKEYYEIRVYELSNPDQEAKLDSYFKNALLPALHRLGISKIGVFKHRENDTASMSKIFLLIPYKSFQQFENSAKKLESDKAYQTAGADYLNAPFDNPPYQRMQKILTRAFAQMPAMQAPTFSTPRSERVYELRSYESATEKLHENKVKMFNDGNEVGLFKRLGFNAVFYSQVIVGKSMPNLMYMITFENMQAHDELWKKFRDDAEWKKLSVMPEYQHNVSHQDIYLLYPAEYSDY